MIDFKNITLADKREMDTCFAGNRCRTCDFSFANLYSWVPKFKTQFSIIDHTLFIRFKEDTSDLYYMMPVGKMPLSKSLTLLIEDAKKNKRDFVIKGVTTKMWKMIEEAMPNTFKYKFDRDNAEYLYLSERLISLSGKKLQKKRNHINRFKLDNPSWEYYPITSQKEIDTCLKMLDEWDEMKPEGIDNADFDYIACKTMLNNFKEMELKGGAINVNGKMIAFTIGAPLTDDTFVVHVEKAFSDVNGVYTTINQQFIEHEASQYTYINREEDMGHEGLRKAKMSYYPDILLEEGVVTFK